MSEPNRLNPLDYFGDYIVGADGNFLYQVFLSSGGLFRRIPKDDLGTPETLTSFADIEAGLTLQPNFLILPSGTMLVIGNVDDNPNPDIIKIYRSDDGGFNWTTTGTLDWLPLGNRGWDIAPDGSVYVIGYDEAETGPTTSLFNITNDGQTLSAAINTWTTTTTIKHAHCCRIINGLMYLGFGDTDDQSGIIRWDFVGDWSNVGSTAPKDINPGTMPGFLGIGGAQRFRCTDIAEFRGKLFSFADASSVQTNETGVWTFNADFTDFTRIDSSINDVVSEFGATEGYWSQNCGDQILFTNLVESNTSNLFDLHIWASNDGETVRDIGIFRCWSDQNTNKICKAFFFDEGKVYFAATVAAGKAQQKGTAVFDFSDEFWMGPNQDIVHPVIWTNSTGSNTNTGFDPRNPKLDPSAVINSTQGDTITAPRGSCVLLEAENYDQGGIAYFSGNVSGSPFPAPASAALQVRGTGKENTSLTVTSDVNMFVQQAGAENNIFFTDMSILPTAMTSNVMFLGSATGTGIVDIQDAIVGDGGESAKRVMQPNNDDVYSVYRSRVKGDTNSLDRFVSDPDTAGGTVRIFACIASGGEYQNLHESGGTIEAYQSAIKEYKKSGIRQTGATTTVPPVIKGMVLHSENPLVDDQTPFRDSGGNTWVDADVDYNIVDITSAPFHGVTDAEVGTHSTIDITVGDAGAFYTDPANDDYTPTQSTIDNNSMVETFTQWGFNGLLMGDTPAIGPFGTIINVLPFDGGPALTSPLTFSLTRPLTSSLTG